MNVTFLILSLVEVFEMFNNSSVKVSEEGDTIKNGIYSNCTQETNMDNIVDYGFMGLSILFLIVFSFLVKRVSFKKHLCSGRPGLLLPMSMLNNHDQTIEFTLAFLSVSEDIYLFTHGNKLELPKSIPITKFFIKLVLAALISVTSYVTFAGLHNKYLIGYIFGAILSTCAIFINIFGSIHFSNCLAGTKIIPFIFEAIVFCLIDVLLLLIFLYKIIKHFFAFNTENNKVKQEKTLNQLLNISYVKELLKIKGKQEKYIMDKNCDMQKLKKRKLKVRIIEKMYKEIPGFTFPPRLIIGISIGLYFAFRIFIDEIYDATPTVWNFINIVNAKYGTTYTNMSTAFKVMFTENPSYSSLDLLNSYRFLTFFYVHLFIACFLSGIVFGLLNSIVNSIFVLRNYRLNFDKITRKGFSSIIKLERAPPAYQLILGFVRFSGYQVAYMLWGILIAIFLITIFLYFVIGFFLLPLIYVKSSWSRRFVMNVGPVIIASIILNFIQTLIVKNIFLKEKGKIMEVNNRRAFIIYCHCAFFLNAMVGIFVSIKRIIVWTVSGVICFGRIDFSALPNYLQGCDNGYMSYIGFLYTEQHHHNPILRCFIDILVESQKHLKKERLQMCQGDKEMNIQFPNVSQVNRSYRNKWRVAYTLVRNQPLLAERKSFLNNSII